VSRFDRAVSGDVGGSRADVRRSDYDPVAEVAAAASSLSAAIEASEQAVRAAQPGYQASVENIRALAEAAALPPPLITRLVAEEEARIATVSALANAERMAAKAQAEFQASAAGYSGAFQGAAIDFLTGVETATGALQNFAARVASILIEQATQDTANAVGTGIASYFSSSSSTTASAMGNVFSPRGVVPFANGGVVSQPSLFSYGGGQIGSIAERGPEAIVPLDRTRSGRLGIAGGGGTTIVNVYGATDANSFRRSEKQIASRAQSAVRPR
jgi:phage-related minor tail protein